MTNLTPINEDDDSSSVSSFETCESTTCKEAYQPNTIYQSPLHILLKHRSLNGGYRLKTLHNQAMPSFPITEVEAAKILQRYSQPQLASPRYQTTHHFPLTEIHAAGILQQVSQS